MLQNQKKLFITQSFKFKIMKKNIFFKLLVFFIFQTFFTTGVYAQTPVNTDVAKMLNAVRLVDNKGTVKYLQSNNGITQIVNTVNDKTTTTWQLGGELTADTYIDVNGKVFALDKLDLLAANTAASIDATDKSVHGTGTGWTLLVRDEATGAIKKMLASDFVTSGNTVHTAVSDATTLTITVTGLKASTPKSRIWVYRNGAKLLPTDFNYADNSITLNEVTGNGPDAWSILNGDVFEVQWMK